MSERSYHRATSYLLLNECIKTFNFLIFLLLLFRKDASIGGSGQSKFEMRQIANFNDHDTQVPFNNNQLFRVII